MLERPAAKSKALELASKHVVSTARAAVERDVGSRLLGFFHGLRGRLVILTVAFVVVGISLFVPVWAANFQDASLRYRIEAAEVAALAVEAAPDGRVSDELSRDLFKKAQVAAVAVVGEDYRTLVLAPATPIDGPVYDIDLDNRSTMRSVLGMFDHLIHEPGRYLQLRAKRVTRPGETLEIIVPEAAVKRSLQGFYKQIVITILTFAGATGVVIYFVLYRAVVRPMRALTESIARFEADPESADLHFRHGGSSEMRRAEQALQGMQQTVVASIRQRRRLADLGEAVAKITHDLRNSLATAQIVSNGLAASDDPRVRNAAPRLERSIERAIGLAEATLDYGRAEPPAPNLRPIDVMPILREASDEACSEWPSVQFLLRPGGAVNAFADPDHVHRIVANLCRNAAQAIVRSQTAGNVTLSAANGGAEVVVDIVDSGPGVPPRVQANLFQPFSASNSRGGSGLGLAIARELARAMHGDLVLVKSDETGASFRLSLPAASGASGRTAAEDAAA